MILTLAPEEVIASLLQQDRDAENLAAEADQARLVQDAPEQARMRADC